MHLAPADGQAPLEPATCSAQVLTASANVDADGSAQPVRLSLAIRSAAAASLLTPVVLARGQQHRKRSVDDRWRSLAAAPAPTAAPVRRPDVPYTMQRVAKGCTGHAGHVILLPDSVYTSYRAGSNIACDYFAPLWLT